MTSILLFAKAELFPSSDCNIVQCNRYGIGIDFGQHNFPRALSGSAYDITNKYICGIFHAHHNSREIRKLFEISAKSIPKIIQSAGSPCRKRSRIIYNQPTLLDHCAVRKFYCASTGGIFDLFHW